MEHRFGGRRGRTRPLLLLVALAAAALVALPGTAGATNYQTYTDPAGDNGNAPDITTVHVSNDPAGNLTFEITLANAPGLSAAEIDINIDADQNPGTGIPDYYGTDSIVSVFAGAIVAPCRWNGSDCSPSISQLGNLIPTYTNGVLTVTVAPADVGVTSGFSFWIGSGVGDFSAALGNFDPAPEYGVWNYQIVPGAPKLVLGKLAVSKPAAGKPFSVGMTLTRQDSGAAVTSGDVVCSGTITKVGVVKGSGKWVNGVATCTFKIPKAAKGKTIKGTITVGFQGATVSKPFSAKIK